MWGFKSPLAHVSPMICPKFGHAPQAAAVRRPSSAPETLFSPLHSTQHPSLLQAVADPPELSPIRRNSRLLRCPDGTWPDHLPAGASMLLSAGGVQDPNRAQPHVARGVGVAGVRDSLRVAQCRL